MDHSNPDELDLSEEDLHNDHNDYELAEDATMAATMGFTSFGGTKPTKEERKDDDDDHHLSRPSKKRRLDHQSDIPGQQATTHTPHRVQPNPQPSTTDEITYTDDEDDFELDTKADLNTGAPPIPAQPQPAAAETTRAANESGRSTPSQSLPQSQFQSQSRSLPERLNTTAWTTMTSNRGGRGGARGGGRQAQGGGHNPLWYVDYYDSSSNENPWEGMEKYKGLAPVGSWVPRYWDTAAAAAAATAGGTAPGAGVADKCGGGSAVRKGVGEDNVAIRLQAIITRPIFPPA
ncbi:hypothetical protein N657DRAFT_681819 [Parathielavia appendiculata]|uniref:Uncharacterized protein n=1 Tax=Parathielavia appendiculata TaxID=2587402 RepID=A0AAN6TYG6_9PEZI|nr:hypothetical protein N657DRAFT_681819 [Parathielavia appendiculata]